MQFNAENEVTKLNFPVFTRSETQNEYASWTRLENAIQDIFKQKELSECSLANLSRGVIDLFHSKGFVWLYNKQTQICKNYVHNELLQMIKENESLEPDFLDHIIAIWKLYVDKMSTIRALFHYIESENGRGVSGSHIGVGGTLSTGGCIRDETVYQPFWEIVMELFQYVLISHNIHEKIIQIALVQIRRLREEIRKKKDGENKAQADKEEERTINRTTLSQINQMFLELDMHVRYWEPAYLRATHQFYEKEAALQLLQLSQVDFLAYCEWRIAQENAFFEQFVRRVGQQSAHDRLDAIMTFCLLERAVPELLSLKSLPVGLPQSDDIITTTKSGASNEAGQQGFVWMIENEQWDVLHLLYRLLERLSPDYRKSIAKFDRESPDLAINQNLIASSSLTASVTASSGLTRLQDTLTTYILQCGTEIVQQNSELTIEASKLVIGKLLAFLVRIEAALDRSFLRNAKFAESVKSAFGKCVNLSPRVLSYQLSKYVDQMMRCAKDIPRHFHIKHLIYLYKVLTEHDDFLSRYHCDFTRRHLLGKSADEDTEFSMLNAIDAESGTNTTYKTRNLYKEMQNGADISKSFQAHLDKASSNASSSSAADTPSSPTFSFGVTVIPQSEYTFSACSDKEIVLPRALSSVWTKFETFYIGINRSKKLAMDMRFSFCLLSANLEAISEANPEVVASSSGAQSGMLSKEIYMPMLQALILLQFNEQETTSFDALRRATGIDEKDLKATLIDLTKAKNQNILVKVAAGSTGNASVYRINDEFKPKQYKLRFRSALEKETTQDETKLTNQLEQDRLNSIKCWIIRLLKAHKKATMKTLIDELISTKKTFEFTSRHIKTQLDKLITDGYIRRDDDDKTLFHYIA